MVEGEGFEPPKAEPADLQSAPVDRLGTPPKGKDCVVYISVLSILLSKIQASKIKYCLNRCTKPP